MVPNADDTPHGRPSGSRVDELFQLRRDVLADSIVFGTRFDDSRGLSASKVYADEPLEVVGRQEERSTTTPVEARSEPLRRHPIVERLWDEALVHETAHRLRKQPAQALCR